MFLARVVGEVVATIKHPDLRARTLLVVHAVTPEGGSAGKVMMAIDTVQAGVGVKSLSVQNTTLDDVFVHYTGRQLRDELVKAHAFTMPARPGLQP